MSPTITACTIVKNEAQNLPLWLRSMQQVADELVIVDTGSADETVSIAESAGAKVFHYAWRDDFAAAKNYAIDHATGDWIIFCDADETFHDEDTPKVRAVIRAVDAEEDVYGIFCTFINVNSDGTERDRDMKLRIFRRLDALRYRGQLHELLTYTGKTPMTTRETRDFAIYHTGYSGEILPGKFRRNIRLLEAAQGTAEARPVDLYYLAECHYGLGEYEAAAKYIERFIGTGQRILYNEERPYSLLIQSWICLGRPKEEIDRKLAEAESRYPDAPIFPWIRGCHAIERQEDTEARTALLACAELAEKKGRDNPIAGRMPQVYATLGTLARKAGQDDEAAWWWMKSLDLAPKTGEALKGLLSLLGDIPDDALIAWLGERYDSEKDAAFLITALPEGRERVELYYRKHGGIATPLWTMYRLAGNLGAASAVLFEEETALCRMAVAAIDGAEGEERQRLERLLPEVYQAAVTEPVRPREYRVRRTLQNFLRKR